jgi:hypothetical protein
MNSASGSVERSRESPHVSHDTFVAQFLGMLLTGIDFHLDSTCRIEASNLDGRASGTLGVRFAHGRTAFVVKFYSRGADDSEQLISPV